MDPSQVLANLPPAVRAAIEARDQHAFQAALEALPPAQLETVVAQLQQAGIIGDGASQAAQVMAQFEPLLQDIAAVARGEPDAPRAEIEKFLQDLDAKGWQLLPAVRRIWNGEGDVEALAAGLDEMHAALIERILELIETPHAPLGEPPSEAEQQKIAQAMNAFAQLPEALRAPLMAGNMQAFMAALEKLPPDQQQKIAQQLSASGILGEEENQAPLDPKQVINALPFEVRMAVEARDANGLRAALAKLPPAQAQTIVQQLARAGIIGTAPAQPEKLDPKQVINSLPFLVRMAVEARDANGLRVELAKLPPAQAQEIMQKLRAAGLM